MMYAIREAATKRLTCWSDETLEDVVLEATEERVRVSTTTQTLMELARLDAGGEPGHIYLDDDLNVTAELPVTPEPEGVDLVGDEFGKYVAEKGLKATTSITVEDMGEVLKRAKAREN